MYLYPLIRSELIRQRQCGLSRPPLRSDRGSRSLFGKETAAALGALLVATIAALTFTTGALAATPKKLPRHGTAPQGASWRVVQDGTGKMTIFIGRRIIYVYYPGPSHPLTSDSVDTSSDCENYQLNCTDEQNCRYWAVNCGRISSTGSDSQAANHDDAADDGLTAQADSWSFGPVTGTIASSEISLTEASADATQNVADPSQGEDC